MPFYELSILQENPIHHIYREIVMRSNIQLDQELLKEYRLGAGLTQQKLAEKAFVASEGYSDKSQLRTYQKIEKTGVTSPKGAGLIAKALGISVH
jgi:DNA-binding XRE family transcriptional regulator